MRIIKAHYTDSPTETIASPSCLRDAKLMHL